MRLNNFFKKYFRHQHIKIIYIYIYIYIKILNKKIKLLKMHGQPRFKMFFLKGV